jgi:hypothetical protein
MSSTKSRVRDINAVLDRMASAYRLLLLAVQESGNLAEFRNVLEMTSSDPRIYRLLAARPETIEALVAFLLSAIEDSRLPDELRDTCRTILERHTSLAAEVEDSA